MATRSRPRTGNQRATNQRNGSRSSQQRRHRDEDGILPVLAKTVREVENSAKRGQVTSLDRARFQAIA
ncbi:MAG TPA: hypothetical protein VFM09_08600, partial [Marmoricola sp.]|nr:hypothetical protein [Marmoricola sp.]